MFIDLFICILQITSDNEDEPFNLNLSDSMMPESSLLDDATDVLADLENLRFDDKDSEKSPTDSFSDFKCFSSTEKILHAEDLLTNNPEDEIKDKSESTDLLLN